MTDRLGREVRPYDPTATIASTSMSRHRRFSPARLAIAALLLMTPTLREQTTITFDDAPAPCFFGEALAPSTRYAPLGVTFTSVGDAGGLILDTCSDFGVPARSGNNFLAFNAYGGFGGPEDVLFATPASAVSLYVSGGYAAGTFLLEGFDASGRLLGSQSVSTTVGAYEPITLAQPNMARVRLTGDTPDTGAPVFVVDDLTFTATATTAVPEPSAELLLLAGVSALVPIVRRRTWVTPPPA